MSCWRPSNVCKSDLPANVLAGYSRKLMHNTYEWTDEYGNRRVRFQKTDVAIFMQDGTVTLNTDGWQTLTTKKRLNAVLDSWRVYQKNHEWFVWNPTTGETIEYEDRMVLPYA